HLAMQSAPVIAQFGAGAGVGARIAASAGLSRAAGRAAGGITATYPSSAGSILSGQMEQAGQYDTPSALALGVPHAAISAVGGVERFIAAGLPRSAIRSRAGRAATTGVTTGATEAGEEVAQQFLEEVGRKAVDPTHDLLGEEAQKRYTESAIGGAALGTAIGGAAGAVSPRPADRVAPPAQAEAPVTPPETQPRDILREYFGRAPTPDEIRQQIALNRGQGELFRPSEMGPLETRQQTLETYGVPPAPVAEPGPVIEPVPAPTPEQGDMLAGTAVETAAELSSELTRAQVALEQDFSQESLIRELRKANN